MGHSMLNLKISRFFVTICHETILFILLLICKYIGEITTCQLHQLRT